MKTPGLITLLALLPAAALAAPPQAPQGSGM
jgi:hypothetical protein